MSFERAERPAEVRCGCGRMIPVGQRGPLPTRCKACRNRRNTIDAAFRRRDRAGERDFLGNQASSLKEIFRDLEMLRKVLAPFDEWGAAKAAEAAQGIERVLAETRARKSALDERKRVLEERWEAAELRRYGLKKW